MTHIDIQETKWDLFMVETLDSALLGGLKYKKSTKLSGIVLRTCIINMLMCISIMDTYHTTYIYQKGNQASTHKTLQEFYIAKA